MFSSALRVRGGLAIAAATAVTNRNFNDAICAPSLGDPKIVVIGAGTAGIGVSAQLANNGHKNVIAIDPADNHYYQPIWSLVGGGRSDNSVSVRPMKSVFPKNASLVKQSVTSIDPSNNSVTLSDGSTVTYDYLVVATGMELNWNAIPGMEDALKDEKSGVVSIYNYENAAKTRRAVTSFTKGRALFTMPTTPVKCPGAPQKIMWLFEERMRDNKHRDDVSVEYWVPGQAMFGVKRYADMLAELQKSRNVIPSFGFVLDSIDGANKEATFKDVKTGETKVEKFDLLHVVPGMAPPEAVKNSPLANDKGFVKVNKHTLQSVDYPNVFALGDCTDTPNSKTAAAITTQAPILVNNLERVIQNKKPNAEYNGYASCPLIVGKNSVILAEFGYDGKIMETFNSETGSFPLSLIGQPGGPMQQHFFFWMKETMFPYVYWALWTKGKWFGTTGPFKPDVTKGKKD